MPRLAQTSRRSQTLGSVLLTCFMVLSPALLASDLSVPVHSANIMATVQHLTRVKILESNNVSLRPGSVYDNATYFESLLALPRPGFNYEFLDSGLGAAEPLYPMFQKGHQGGYKQLASAMISESSRHIDHFTSLDTPEGCRVDGAYLLRGIDEYPKSQFKTERDEGYTMIIVRLDHYTRLRADAQCGRHRANDPDPDFDPAKFLADHRGAMTLADFPAKELGRFEAKLSAIYHINQTMWPDHAKFDLNDLSRNSLYYYPAGHSFDYDIKTPRPQPELGYFNRPAHMIVPASAAVQGAFPLDSLIGDAEFKAVLDFLSGRPTPEFDPQSEPGHDTFRLTDVTPNNIYTSGLYIEPIRDAIGDVSNPKNYRLVGMTIKPYEEQEDVAWQGTRVVPQIRFVYQLIDPRDPTRAFEQLFLHLKWDVIDRTSSEQTREAQHRYFLRRVDQLTRAREDPNDDGTTLRQFIAEFTAGRPVETIAVSTSLTGIWVFGALTRDQNPGRRLQAMRIVRDGVDVGYYSSAYDNDVFRTALAKAQGSRKAALEKHLDEVTVSFYRDPRRQDVHTLNFNRVTCAQCHQTSGRDGVHVAFNDGVDRRIKSPINVTEYFFREADAQLEAGSRYWFDR